MKTPYIILQCPRCGESVNVEIADDATGTCPECGLTCLLRIVWQVESEFAEEDG